MARFTLILEFRGGTYIRQERAASPQAALKKLVRPTDTKTKLFRALAEQRVVAIDGIENCWCSSALDRGKLALVNIIKNAE